MLKTQWFSDTCKAAVQPHQNIWVAYSGGVDSHVLLHLARACFSKVRAVHINHALSPNANAWQQHCENVCANLDVELKCITVDAKPKPKQSPEDAARKARRTAWQTMLGADDILLTAHHAADQAETILYRLFRGTGPSGLAGMQQSTNIGLATLLRPLLNISKEEILKYAAKNNLQHIVDESNSNDKYDRNFIRNNILPLLSQRWSTVTNSINRAGKLSNQLVSCLQPHVQQQLLNVLETNDCEINITKLSGFEATWQTEVLRAWLQMHKVTPTLEQIELIKKEVINSNSDANPKLQISNKVVRRNKGKLYLLDLETNLTAKNTDITQFAIQWDLTQPIDLPDGTTITAQQISQNAQYIKNLQQQNIVVKKGSHGPKAKKLFQKLGVPSWERKKYPLIFADGSLINIVGLWARVQN